MHSCAQRPPAAAAPARAESEAERDGGAVRAAQAGQAEGSAAPPGGHRKRARVAVLQATRADALNLEESERSLGAFITLHPCLRLALGF